MTYPVKYYWKDQQGKLQKTWGVELTEDEKYALAKKNNALIREQMSGKENTTVS